MQIYTALGCALSLLPAGGQGGQQWRLNPQGPGSLVTPWHWLGHDSALVLSGVTAKDLPGQTEGGAHRFQKCELHGHCA